MFTVKDFERVAEEGPLTSRSSDLMDPKNPNAVPRRLSGMSNSVVVDMVRVLLFHVLDRDGLTISKVMQFVDYYLSVSNIVIKSNQSLDTDGQVGNVNSYTVQIVPAVSRPTVAPLPEVKPEVVMESQKVDPLHVVGVAACDNIIRRGNMIELMNHPETPMFIGDERMIDTKDHEALSTYKVLQDIGKRRARLIDKRKFAIFQQSNISSIESRIGDIRSEEIAHPVVVESRNYTDRRYHSRNALTEIYENKLELDGYLDRVFQCKPAVEKYIKDNQVERPVNITVPKVISQDEIDYGICRGCRKIMVRSFHHDHCLRLANEARALVHKSWLQVADCFRGSRSDGCIFVHKLVDELMQEYDRRYDVFGGVDDPGAPVEELNDVYQGIIDNFFVLRVWRKV